MLLVDRIVGVLAPHTCVSCGKEGSVLCSLCLASAGEPPASRCVGCKQLSDDYKTCNTCRNWIDIYAVYVANEYDDVYERLLHAFKFSVQRQAVHPIVQMMQQVTPPFGQDQLLLCPLPTAPRRIRQRGFDHGVLLARQFWRTLPPIAQQQIVLGPTTLGRRTNARQLGSDRAQRIAQMQNEFFVRKPSDIVGKTCLLLDDVTTTGASLAAAARVLKDAGAARVYAVVYAQKV